MLGIFNRRAALTLAAALVLGATAAASADEAKVAIDNFAFTPAELTVKPGTTVIFENQDDIPHLVVADDGAYRSKALDTNDRFSFTFDKAGEYPYYCGIHPHMKGKIVVAP
jgi:plastocyanin